MRKIGTLRNFSNGWHIYIGRGIYRPLRNMAGWKHDWRAQA